MPKVTIDSLRTQTRDELKGLILEYMKASRIGVSDIAQCLGCGRTTASRRLNEHTDEWSIREIRDVCLFLKIPQYEVKKSIRL